MPPKKKQASSESKVGLIVSLVFFVLATCILGYTTYLGFADQDAKDKAVKEAKKGEEIMKGDRDWYRFQARAFRLYMGYPPEGADMAALQRDKASFDKKQLAYATNQKDNADVGKVFDQVAKQLPWDANVDQQPRGTFQTLLQERDKQRAALEKRLAQVQDEKTAAERRAKEAEDLAKEEKKIFAQALVNLDKKAEADRANDRAQVAKLMADLNAKSQEKEKESFAGVNLKKDVARLQLESGKLKTERDALRKDKKELQEVVEDLKNKLDATLALAGTDKQTVERKTLDAKATQLLKTWNKDWQIVAMDPRGSLPYINLGSADRITPQVTFSIHSIGLDGKLSQVPKGTLEVVQVIGPNLSRARLTSVRDAKADPILKGDRLFNPTWDPVVRKHVAVAGVIDLHGDQKDSTQEFLRMLERQGVTVDAYLDPTDWAEKGRGISANTDYLIVGTNLDFLNNDTRGRDKDLVSKVDRAMKSMREKALLNGVPLISFRKYLELSGYRPLRSTGEGDPARLGGGRY